MTGLLAAYASVALVTAFLCFGAAEGMDRTASLSLREEALLTFGWVIWPLTLVTIARRWGRAVDRYGRG